MTLKCHKPSLFTVVILFITKFLVCAQVQPPAYKMGSQVNYVRTWTATAPEQDPNKLVARPLKDVTQSTQYLDGLGRPVQTVIQGGSLVTGNSPTDLSNITEYDAFGREVHNWMPFASTEANGSFKTDPFTLQHDFMQGQYGEQGESYFYGQTDFEASPINRPIKKYAAGNSWVGSRRGIAQGYWANSEIDSVVIWKVNDILTPGLFGSYNNMGFYTSGQLHKDVITDEDGRQVIEFKDKEDRLILRKVQFGASIDNGTGCGYNGWINTYNIYDDIGNLRCVVQPSGVAQLARNNWDMTDTTILKEQCFRYEYDQRSRMITKQDPGTQPVYMVYDARDRQVMKQDGNMRLAGNWLVTAYDDLNRAVQTGMLPDGTTFGTHLKNSFGSILYPASVGDPLTQTHYDDYNGLPNGLSSNYNNVWNGNFAGTNNNNWPYPQMPSQNTNVTTKGLVTWSQVKVLDRPTVLSTVNIYDDFGRQVQSQSQSQNISNGLDVATTQYSWSGEPLVEVRKMDKVTQATVTVSNRSYDDLGRLVQTRKKLSNSLVNNNAMSDFTSISIKQYDALGQLAEKQLGKQRNMDGSQTSMMLDKQDFEYNIRGWLLGMNRDYVHDLSTATDAGSGESFTTPIMLGPGNYFGFDLGYDKNGILDAYSHQYNGNISGTIWKSAHDGQVRKYDFGYDAVKRLANADFNQYTGNGFNKTANIDFSASNLCYDVNGNILGMKQMGVVGNLSLPIDQLKYTYASGSNRLQQVIDTANNNASTLSDFKYEEAGKTAVDYGYDANVNIISDANKRISSISYNYLNLPQLITLDGNRTIAYSYDALGNKLQKTITEGNRTTITDYIGDAVFQNDTLLFISMEEGRIRPNAVSNGFVFDYFLKDQLGNTRMSITDDPTMDSQILDATSYYPFGLAMSGISCDSKNASENTYKYNGKDLQHHEFCDSSGLELYDYGARTQDPQLGRMWQQDPMASSYQRLTPYNYVANNPVNGIDPDGRDVIFLNASTGAHGTGHASVIIGNATDGWFYYSLNGTESQSLYGDSFKPDIGTSMGNEKNIRNLITKANTINPFQLHDYDRFVMIKTTSEEDRAMKVKAAEAASVQKYIVIGQSCLNVAKAAYNTLVDDRVGYVHDYVDLGTRNDPIPDTWFLGLPNTFNNLNSFMNFLGVGNGNIFVSPPKPQPVIVVGSTLHQ